MRPDAGVPVPADPTADALAAMVALRRLADRLEDAVGVCGVR